MGLNVEHQPTGLGTSKMTGIRWQVLAILFLTCLVSYFDRVNVTMAGQFIMQKYGLSKVEYGMVWSAFLISYSAFQIPGGYLSNKYGPRVTGAVILVFWSIFTVITPMATGFMSLLIIRFIFGMGEAPMFPNNGSVLQKWFSKDEKATTSGIMMTGAFIGPAFAAPISVWIMSNWGWEMLFYSYGGTGIITAILWYWIVRDQPHLHPGVNEAEAKHIGEPVPPQAIPWSLWKRFLGSVQFWAHGLQYMVACYILYIFLSWIPIYLLEVQKMSLKAMGFAASYPFFAMSAFMIVGGKISDMLVKNGHSKQIARATLGAIGILGSGIFMYLGANAGAPNATLIFLTMSLGFLGFNVTASWTMCQDLGRKQTVPVVSWMITWANIAGIICAPLTAVFVEQFGWIQALNISAIFAIVGAALCLFVRPDKPLHD